MANIATETHHSIVTAIAGLRDDMVAARDATPVRNGYSNFESAIKLLNFCRVAIGDERDQNQIAFILRNADIGLSMWEVGAAGEAVERARENLKTLTSGI